MKSSYEKDLKSVNTRSNLYICLLILTLFGMGFFSIVSDGGGARPPPHHNFIVIAPMTMKYGTGVKLDVFYTMVTKNCDVTTITSL